MTSVPSPLIRFEEPAQGDYFNAWAAPLIQAMQKLEFAIAGLTTVTTTGGTTALTVNNYVPDQASSSAILVQGALTSNAAVLAPQIDHEFTVINNTTGAFSLTFGVTGQPPVTIPQGASARVRTIAATGASFFVGPLVSLTTGAALVATDPTKLPLAGGTMTGILNMGNLKVINLQTPTNPADAATKNYVDSNSVFAAQTALFAGGVNFNSGNTDNAIAVTLPFWATRYTVLAVLISAASGSITTATAGLFTAPGGAGVAVCSTQALTVSTSADATNNNAMQLNVNNSVSESYVQANEPTLYFRVGTAEGGAVTANVMIVIRPLS